MMKMYSEEFKADAVALCKADPGLSIAQIARDLGVHPETLRSWVRADRNLHGEENTSSSRRDQVAESPVEAENRELRKEVARLRAERDILRKAAKYFAGETGW